MPPFPRRSRRASSKKRPPRANRRAQRGRIVLLACAAALLILPVVLIASPVSYIPLVAAALLVALSWGYLRVLRRSLSVDVAQMAGSCERGQGTDLQVTLASSCILPYPRIQLEFFVTDLFGGYDDVRTVSCALGSRETAHLNFQVSFVHLGTYQAGVSRIVVHDLLGLFSATLPDGARRSVVVRPRRVDMGRAADMQAVPDESNRALRPVAADDVDYASVREYRYGDPLKTIHWNLSARFPDNTMYTRLFEAYVNPSLAVIIDPYSPDLGSEDLMCLFDGMVETAVGLCAQARAAGIDAEVRYVQPDGTPAAARIASASDADDLVSSMMRITPAQAKDAQSGLAEQMLRTAGLQSHGFGNAALVTSRSDAGQITALSEIAMRRRNAMAFIAVPRMLEGRDRDSFLAPLHRLDATGAVYYVVESNEVATEVSGL